MKNYGTYPVVRWPGLLLAMGIICLAAGCSKVGVDIEDIYDARGRIVSIDDQTPVDGGVTIIISLDKGGPPVLYMTSLYTYPPPDEDHIKLYETIRELKRGQRIGATGIKEDGKLILTRVDPL
jgi:hypothetical protein